MTIGLSKKKLASLIDDRPDGIASAATLFH